MKNEAIIDQLHSNSKVFQSLLDVQDSKQILWKSAADKWCLLEVVCHLRDEESADFRARLDHILYRPEAVMQPIDPVAWVTERNYIGQPYAKAVADFLDERAKSVLWLKQRTSAPWGNAYIHPKAGKMTADFILANWLAHDYLHIRQINRIKYEFLESKGLKLDYAGNWLASCGLATFQQLYQGVHQLRNIHSTRVTREL